MPTMAVMWVSVPKTWMGIPVVLPEESRGNQNRWTIRQCSLKSKKKNASQTELWQHTNFSHHSETFLIVGAAATDKNGDLMLLQRHLIVPDCADDSLRDGNGR